MSQTTNSYQLIVSCANAPELGWYTFNTNTKRLSHQQPLPADQFAMPMALTQDYLFVATRGNPCSILVYHIKREKEHVAIEFVKQIPIAANLAYIAIHAQENVLIGASYGGDSIWVYDIPALLNYSDTNQTMLPELQKITQISHAHAVAISQDGQHIYVSALGSDQLFVYQFQDHLLTEIEHIDLDNNFGPRHLCFNTDDSQLYVLSEFKAIVAIFNRHKTTGRLTLVNYSMPSPSLSLFKQGQARPNYTDPVQPDPKEIAQWIWAADIKFNPNSELLVVSERTSSQLIIHNTNQETANVLFTEDVETQPRGFTLSPCGHFLFVCGEQSPYLSAYEIDTHTGELTQCDRILLFPDKPHETHFNANWITVIQ